MTASPSLPEGKVAVCPVCDTASVQVNASSTAAATNPDAARYRCADCYRRFDEFDVRDRATTTDTLCGLAKRLDEAAPDSVSR